MKIKLLPVAVILLVLLNGVLIFMLIEKPHEKNSTPKNDNFLITQLNFSEEQKEIFSTLDNEHKNKMMRLEDQVRENKDALFSSFNNDNKDIKIFATELGNLATEKEIEIFRFFKQVRNICSQEQQKKFDEIIEMALKRGGGQGPPPHENGERPEHPPMGGDRPPRDREMPPPPR
ncbi:hypothetical protein N9V96_00510 [Polaribacter sp.]|nr:hypothetical protein [Polaribacter sp.]